MEIALGIPVVESVSGWSFGPHLCLAGELARMTERLHVHVPVNIVPHDRARHTIMQQVLRNEQVKYLIFVDDDTTVPVGGVGRLVEIMEERKPAVVVGHYRMRGHPYLCVWAKKEKDGKFWRVDADSGVHEIDSAGLGCAVVDLDFVRTRMSPPWFQMLKDEHGLTMVTDDTTFFRQVRERGGVVLGCADVRCTHVGNRELINDRTADRLRAAAVEANVCPTEPVPIGPE